MFFPSQIGLKIWILEESYLEFFDCSELIRFSLTVDCEGYHLS